MEEAAEADIQDGEIIQKSESEDNSSKKLSDTIDSLTLEFTCTICQELFVEARTLQCAHTFCAHVIAWMGGLSEIVEVSVDRVLFADEGWKRKDSPPSY